MVLGLPGDAEALVEVGVTGRGASAPLAGRRVVYLDQNQWSALAAWRHGHRPLADSEASTAERLAALVTARQIVGPMSGGHLAETVRLSRTRRVALASTLLEFGSQVRARIWCQTRSLFREGRRAFGVGVNDCVWSLRA
jgi:hypothetical protein